MILIFDYDGTLHDTAALYGHAVRSVLKELEEIGYPSKRECSDQSLSKYLGMTARAMWEDYMPSLPEAPRQSAIEKVGRLMREGIRSGKAKLYEGVPTLLADLKAEGHTLIILSNCRQSYMDAHRSCFSLDRFISAYYCSGDYQDAPKEVIFETIRKEFPGDYVMIGDRASDIRVGLVHHIPTIGCAYGFGDEKELRGADHIARSVKKIGECIRSLG